MKNDFQDKCERAKNKRHYTEWEMKRVKFTILALLHYTTLGQL